MALAMSSGCATQRSGNDEPGAFLRESDSGRASESDSGRAADAGQRTCDQDNGIAQISSRSWYGVGPKISSPKV